MYLKRFKLALFVAIAIVSTASLAQNNSIEFDIRSQDLGNALTEFGIQSGMEVFFVAKEVKGKISDSIKGYFDAETAIKRLLKDSGINYTIDQNGTVLVGKKYSPKNKNQAPSQDETSDEQEEYDDSEALDIVVVTGSQLITEPSSLSRQMDVFEIEEMRAMGAHDLDSFFRLLPQNIASASRVGAGVGDDNTFGTTRNVYGASSVNLRGIGDGATLILVDGRRTARGGVFGEAVDINNFPLFMIERIEIIYDGASAIYGSDAIGGVVNIITKKDYEGTSVDIVHSLPSQGGTARTQVDLGHTFSWDNSRLTLGVSGNFETQLDGQERDIGFATQFPPVPFGSPANIGSGQTVFNGNGEEITLPLFYIDPVTGERILSQELTEVCFDFPPLGEICNEQLTWIGDLRDISNLTPINSAQLDAGFTGVLGLNDINDLEASASGLRDERNITLIPKSDAVNYRMNYAYDFANDTSFQINMGYNSNKSSYTSSNSNLTLFVAPQLSSPFNSSVELYMAADFLPISIQDTDSTNLNISSLLDGSFSNDWTWEVGYSISKSNYRSLKKNTKNRSNFSILANGVSFDPVTFENTPSPYNPFETLFGLSSEAEFIEHFIIPELLTTTDTLNSDLDFKFRGSVFETNAGKAMMLFGAGVSREELGIYDESATVLSSRVLGDFFPEIGDIAYDEEVTRSPHFFNTEIYIPLVSEKNAFSGMQQFALTGAYRHDDYGVFAGESWAAGLIYSPTSWLDVVANVTESFKAPNLADSALQVTATGEFNVVYDEFREINFSNGQPEYYEYLAIRGGNPNLKDEKGETASFGLRFTPESVPDFYAEINYSENEFTDQIGQLSSVIDARWIAFELDAIRSGNLVNPILTFENGMFVQESRSFNVSDQQVRNLDAKVNYTFYTDNLGSIRFNLSYNRALENSLRLADESICADGACAFLGVNTNIGNDNLNASEFINRVGSVDSFRSFVFPEHRATFSVDWQLGGFAVNLLYLYQSDTDRPERVGSLIGDNGSGAITRVTTSPVKPVNLQLSYDFRHISWLNVDSARLVFTVPNLFNDALEISRSPAIPNLPEGRLDPRATDPYGRVYTLRFQASF